MQEALVGGALNLSTVTWEDPSSLRREEMVLNELERQRTSRWLHGMLLHQVATYVGGKDARPTLTTLRETLLQVEFPWLVAAPAQEEKPKDLTAIYNAAIKNVEQRYGPLKPAPVEEPASRTRKAGKRR